MFGIVNKYPYIHTHGYGLYYRKKNIKSLKKKFGSLEINCTFVVLSVDNVAL